MIRVDRENNAFFESEYNRCNARLYATAYRIVCDAELAEEVMHDTLLKYFNSREKFDSTLDADRWMLRVCINLAIDKLRDAYRRKTLCLENIEVLPQYLWAEQEVEQGIIPRFSTVQITHALSKLKKIYSTVLSLILIEGYDPSEVSKIIDVKEVTVRSQYLRGKEALRKELLKTK